MMMMTIKSLKQSNPEFLGSKNSRNIKIHLRGILGFKTFLLLGYY